MAKTAERLTDRAIRALKPRDKAYLVPDGRGLYLRVQTGGARSWLVRYQIAGKVHDLGLGSYPERTLAAARQMALGARRDRMNGTDPLAAKHQEKRKAAPTFRTMADAYITGHESGWRNAKHGAQWGATLAAYVYPALGARPVSEITASDVLGVLAPIWADKTETAARVRGRIEAILDYAKVLGHRSGENPAAWKGNLALTLPARQKVAKVEHHASMPYGELPGFLAVLRGRSGMAARCLEFVILTAARTGEAIGATWPEIDEEARLWVIPGERMKGGREHRVPLSGAAAGLLAALPRGGAKVFGGSNMAMTMTLRRMGRGDLTVHGFRATFSTWCAEHGVATDLREMALAHVEGDKVSAAYQRSDLIERRRDLAERWARYCDGEGGTKVIHLRTGVA